MAEFQARPGRGWDTDGGIRTGKEKERSVKAVKKVARLILEDGSEFRGISRAHHASVAGEVVFTTGMVGYPQSLTDPSYKGQILVSTWPLMGNYGVPGNDADERGIPLFFESGRVQATAFVVSEYCEQPSHWASASTLADWLKKQKVPLIEGIDTRALTERLRERGVMRGKILVEGCAEVELDDGDALIKGAVKAVSVKEIREYLPYDAGSDSWKRMGSPARTGEGLRVCLLDYGVKYNIIRCFLARGAAVSLVPWDQDLSRLSYDGLFLSNGPGDPKDLMASVLQVRAAMERPEPVCGICMGNHILGLAAGGDTYKLPYGHRAQNQPCVETGTKRCYVTSQNHGYAVDQTRCPGDWEPWFVNLNDGTNEGVRLRDRAVFSVQFHPEGRPGPTDTEFLFDEFLALAGSLRLARISE